MRRARDDNLLGSRRAGKGAFGQVVELDPRRSPGRTGTSSDQPVDAERIRRWWEAGECAGMGFEEAAPRLRSG